MRLALVVMCMTMLGCSAQGQKTDPGGGTTDTGSGSGPSGSTGSGTPEPDPETVAGTVGIVLIDAQEAFVNIASNGDMAGIIERTKATLALGTQHDVPTFLTFEDSQTGDHALHAPLEAAVPAHAQKFTKTTFDATGQPTFAAALQQSKLSHLVVMGAETDVCVLQTVLGMRKMGFTVLLESDAVFTSETNTSPALRRMQQAGAIMVSSSDVAGYVAKPDALPKGTDVTVTITDPLHVGVVLNDFTNASVGSSSDPLTTQKSARLRELLLVSEWFELPVYADAPLPSAYASYYNGQLRPLAQIAQDSSVTQLVFAGTDGNLANALQTASHQFVMEDALLALGTPAAQEALLQPFYDNGTVPTTYKSFYYDMTKSVDLAEWPSQTWVQRYDEYFWITQAPEDLPPIPG